MTHSLLRWLPLLAAGLAYLVAPTAALVWDDQILVTQQLPSFQSFADLLQPPAGIPQWSYAYYRPVVVVTYLLDAWLFGPGSAIGPHAMNVLYHMLTTLFVALLARRLVGRNGEGELAAIAAATLFAVHPIHTESVSWVAGRSDLLATLLLVPALHLALRWRDEGLTWQLLASPLLFLLALLTKEVAIAGLALLPLLWVFAPVGAPLGATGVSFEERLSDDGETPVAPKGAPTGRFVMQALTWLGAAWVWWSLRLAGGASLSVSPSGSEMLFWNPLRAAAWYLQKLLVPWPQANFAVWEMVPSVTMSLAILGVAALALLASARLWWQNKNAGILLGICWTGLALAPSLAATLSGVAETPVAERYLYLPSVGFAIAVGGALALLLQATGSAGGRRVVLGGYALLCAVLLALCLQRGLVWQNDLRLWTDATARAPDYALPWVERGKAQAASGDDGTALDFFERARTLKGSAQTRAVASYNTGLLYAQRNEIFRAEQAFREAVTINPAYGKGYYGLGRIALARATGPGAGTTEERRLLLDQGAADLQRAIEISPGFVDAWVQLARVLAARGDSGSALAALASAERLDPGVMARPEVVAFRQSLQQSLQLESGNIRP